MTNQAKYSVGDGGPIASTKFVVRCHGILVRDDKQGPLLFDTETEANAFISMTVGEEAK